MVNPEQKPAQTPVYCARHPNIETHLRCSKCETPICPRCLVYTPVGARCPTCAALKRVPAYDVTPELYLRAVGAAIGLAIVLGVAWSFFGSFGWFGFIIAAGIGYVVGEAISRVTRYKRGLGLQVIAGIAILLAFFLRGLFPVILRAPDVVLDANLMMRLGEQSVTSLFSSPMSLIMVGIAIFIAVRRL